MSRGGRPERATSISPARKDSTVASRLPIRKRNSTFGREATKPAISRGAKYFAVDTAPTDNRPPSPGGDRVHRVSEIAHRPPDAAGSLERRFAGGGQAHAGGARSNSFSPTAFSRPLTRAVSAAGVIFSAAAAWTSEPASAIA